MSHSDFNLTGKSDQELLRSAKSLKIEVDGVVIGYAWDAGPTSHTFRIGGMNCQADSMPECLQRLAKALSEPPF